MILRLLLLIVAAGAIGWALHYRQVWRAQRRLRLLGRRLQMHGIDFASWLAEARLEEAALRDHRRRDEVQARLIAAAERLLPEA